LGAGADAAAEDGVEFGADFGEGRGVFGEDVVAAEVLESV
jgi:hypothetical protein|tara:strand:+ start:20410 stop:20529 length:120 start_codon:yes stop_codon:yes gene_type:complete